MKKGDVVLCIKNFTHNHYSFIKNKTYVILYEHYRLVAVAPKNYSRLENEILGKSSEHFWFSIEPETGQQFLFKEYFVNLQKNRKDKINKINENIY